MLRTPGVPVGWRELARRTAVEVVGGNCLGLAAQLAFYFVLALFPALLFLVAIVSFVPLANLLETLTGTLARIAPREVLILIEDQVLGIAQDKDSGLLTLGMLGTIWSTSAGVTAIIDTLNRAYGVQESRPWWRVRLTALGLTVALMLFVVLSTVLVIAGPTLAERVAAWLYLGPAFTWSWKILQWPVVFALVSFTVAIVYYYGPDAEQEWIWITPGSVFATFLWLLVSLGFKFYVTSFGSYNATYGAIGGVIVLMLWFYVSGLAVLVGAELNAEIEHASPYGKDAGENAPGEKKTIGLLALRRSKERRQAGVFRPAVAAANCEVDRELPPAGPAAVLPVRPAHWLLSLVVVGEAILLTYLKLRVRLKRVSASR